MTPEQRVCQIEQRLSRIEEHLKLEEKQAVQYYRYSETREVARIDRTQKSVMLVCGDCLSSYYEVIGNWENIPYIVHDGQELWDGCLVECYDSESYFLRQTSFFDAENKTSFGTVDGKRGGAGWNHYKLIQQELWPEWAFDAYKRLRL